MTPRLFKLVLIGVATALAGCATPPAAEVDYSAFRESKPGSILVLPPLNHTVEVDAASAVMAQATVPLAESGYYVLPVAMVAETFRQNGVQTADDAQAVPLAKLREIFGADAALYLDVKQYGSTYSVLSSVVVVEVEARLIDLRNGAKLWQGKRLVRRDSSSAGAGLLGMLVQAVVDQIVSTLNDRGYDVAGQANQELLAAGQPGGLLYGPRSPKYELRR